MKKITAYVVLISVFILNSGAGCSDKKKSPSPNMLNCSLVAAGTCTKPIPYQQVIKSR